MLVKALYSLALSGYYCISIRMVRMDGFMGKVLEFYN